MKPIYIKVLKQRQSTPTLHGPGEVYKHYIVVRLGGP